MKKLSTFIALCIFCSSAYTLEDTKENRVAMTKSYLKVFNMEQTLGDINNALLMSIPQEEQEIFKTILGKHMNAAFIEKLTIETMPEHFTVDEIEALSNFYASKHGKTILEKMGTYSGAVGTKLMMEMATLFPEIEKEMAQLKASV